MPKLYCSLLFIVLSVASFGGTPPDITFGKVDKATLAMTHHPLDSTAGAVVLGDYGSSRIDYTQAQGLQIIFTRHSRIKILNSSAYDLANVYVNLYKQGNDEEKISQIKGYTYNLEDGKVVKTKINRKDVFEEAYSDHLNRAKFTLPNVKEGAVIEYSYRVTSEFLSYLRDWDFQREIPTAWSEYKVTIPEYFHYNQLARGYHPLVINERSTSSGSFRFNNKERTGDRVTKTEMTHSTMDFQQLEQRWAAQDVPALTEEPYITTMNDYTTQMAFELSSINIPGQSYQDFSSNWEEVDKELMDHTYFGGLLNHSQSVRKTAETVVAGATSPHEKMVRLFNYVRDHIKWNDASRLVGSQSLKKTLSEGTGNSADANLLLVALLREAGLTAYPVVLSTRDHGMVREPFPRINQFNYVIAQVQVDSTLQLLDATDPLCPYNLLPLRCLNNRGRIVGPLVAEHWVPLQANASSTHMVVANLTIEDNQLVGEVVRSNAQYDALRLRKKLASFSSRDNFVTNVKQSQPGIQHYELAQDEALEESVKETMQVAFSTGLQQAGKVLYIDPFVIESEENPFKSTERTYPVDYPHLSRHLYILNLTIPEGYVVDELPETTSIALPNNGGTYRFTATQRGNVLQINSQLNISKTRFYAQEYAALQLFHQQMADKQREQIVLAKQ